ncbi:hypothetical protein [Anaerosporobacter sp.]|uniref:hypothetical protein n=1 Tax=Anaerosporobacter sp. TaxID=1872529 RepID=UPI00286F7DE9|nr:hypothetical protein [Anaerosporobacter sp.]
MLETEIITKLENEKTNVNGKSDVSKTGDSNSVTLWFLVFGISGMSITYLGVRRKKKQAKF